MKRILAIIGFIFCGLSAFGQYPIPQGLGGDSTLVTSKGGFKGRLINWSFTDTASANLQPIRTYAGAMIFVHNAIYFRDSSATRWVQLIPNGGANTSDTMYWKIGGNDLSAFTGLPYFGTKSHQDFNVATNNLKRFSVNKDGIQANNIHVVNLGIDSTTGYLAYGSSGGGGGGWSLTGNAGTDVATNFIGTTDSVHSLNGRLWNHPAFYVAQPVMKLSSSPQNRPDWGGQSITTLGYGAGEALINLEHAGHLTDIPGASTGSSNILIGLYAGTHIGEKLDPDSTNLGVQSTTIIGTLAGMNMQYGQGGDYGRATAIGANAMFTTIEAGNSTAVGAFSQERQSKGLGNTSVGAHSLRTIVNGSFNTALGVASGYFSTGIIGSVSMGSVGSGYTTATVTIDSPRLYGQPNMTAIGETPATAHAVIVGGQITSIVIDNPGAGYSEVYSTTFTHGMNNPPQVHISGDGVGASATATVINSNANSYVGYGSNWMYRAGWGNIGIGYFSGNGVMRYKDTTTNLLGTYSQVAAYVPWTTNLTNATAIGAYTKVGQSNTVVLGDSAQGTQVSIGTSLPTASLHVKGSLRFVTGNQAAGRVLTSDANGGADWTTASTPAGNYGNIQINRNGVLTTPGLDSLNYDNIGVLTVKGDRILLDNSTDGIYLDFGNIVGGVGGLYNYGDDSPIATYELSTGKFNYGNNSLMLNPRTGKDTLLGTLNISDSLKAGTVKRIGGTSSQFLKADGSVDASTYATTANLALKVNISDTSTTLSHYFNQIGYGILNTGQAIRVDSATINTAMRSYVSGGYLPLAGGTLTGNLLFSTDNTKDIGATGATRPRTLYLGTSLIAPLDSITGNAIANSSPIHGNGTWFTGGSATTTKPYLLIEPTATTSTAWNVNGTAIGANAPTGFTGNLIDAQLAGVSKLMVDYTGRLTSATELFATSYVKSLLSSNTAFYAPTGGIYAGGAVNNYFAGNVGVNTLSPTTKLQVNAGTAEKMISWGSAASGSYVEKGNLDSLGGATVTRLKTGYVAKTTTYSATNADHTIDCTSGTFTVTLPTAVSAQGQEYIVKNSGTGSITVATTSSQTIDGGTTYTLGTQYKYVHVKSNNANWIIIGNN